MKLDTAFTSLCHSVQLTQTERNIDCNELNLDSVFFSIVYFVLLPIQLTTQTKTKFSFIVLISIKTNDE